MAESDVPLVSIRNVSKTFPGQRALDDVSFDILSGEVHALLGHNGSGKSTLIKVLAGVHHPDPGGTVLVRGRPLPLGSPSDSTAAGLRFVHQDLGLIDDLTVLENVALAAGYSSTRTQTISWSEQRRRTRELLSLLDADIDVDAPLHTLPAIDKSVVAIARALDGIAGSGGLLVLDEPTAALPPDEVDRLFSIVRRLRDSGVSTLYVTHRMDEVFVLTDRFTVLRDGRHQITGRTADFDTDALVGLILGDAGAAASPPAAPASPEHGAVLLDVKGLRSPLLDGLDLTVHEGEIIGIAGVMGSGREEVGPALVGSVASSAERYVTALGETNTINPRRARSLGVVLVPGSRGPGSLIDDFSVTENLTIPVLERFRRGGVLDKRTERGIVERWIERFDVRPPRPDAALRELSGGNKQKVLVAKWLNTDPRVLIVDEPTAGVDVGASAAIHAFIREVASTGMGCVVASSDIADLIAVCSKVLVLRHGSVSAVLEGPAVTEQNILRAMSASVANQSPTTDAPDTRSGPVHG